MSQDYKTRGEAIDAQVVANAIQKYCPFRDKECRMDCACLQEAQLWTNDHPYNGMKFSVSPSRCGRSA